MQKLTGTDKAAIVLLALGEELAAAIMSAMPRAEASKVAVALGRLGRVDEGTVQGVLAEFNDGLAREGPARGLVGDAASARRLLKAARPGDAVDDALDMASPTLAATLAALAPADLARFLKDEHPQTIALTLAHLDARASGAVLKALPAALHAEAIVRIARLEAVDPQVLLDLEDAIRDGIGRTRLSASQRKGGPQQVAALLAGLDEAARGTQLRRLAETDPALADEVRALLFVFADVARLDDRGIQELLKAVAEPQLKLALKAAPPALQERFFTNMSARRAASLREDLAAMPKTKMSDVEAAQKDVAALARTLIDAGKIVDPRAAA